MELSFAPMEGITYAAYRRLHAEMFPGADRYCAPFIAPDSAGNFKAGSLRDVLPEENTGVRLVPQLLVNAAAPFLAVARELQALGYTEVNLNTGCPSGTVVAKHKGAGMLGDPAALDACLAEIFARCPLRVSVKTRLGLHSAAEFPQLLEVYRRYPLARLTVHVRHRDGMYRSEPDREAFAAVPDQTAGILRRRFLDRNIPDDRTLDTILLYRLRSMTTEEYASLPDLSEGLENALRNAAVTARTRQELLDAVSCSRYPASRISRLCAYALLQVSRKDLASVPLPENALLLGLRKNPDMTARWKQLSLPVISSFTEWKKAAHPADLLAWRLWAQCCRLPATLPFSEKTVSL